MIRFLARVTLQRAQLSQIELTDNQEPQHCPIEHRKCCTTRIASHTHPQCMQTLAKNHVRVTRTRMRAMLTQMCTRTQAVAHVRATTNGHIRASTPTSAWNNTNELYHRNQHSVQRRSRSAGGHKPPEGRHGQGMVGVANTMAAAANSSRGMKSDPQPAIALLIQRNAPR